MAWVYLPRIDNYEVFDLRASNAQLQALCGKSVDLGEESWAPSWITQAEVAQDAVVRYWARRYTNPNIGTRGGALLRPTDSWRPLARGFVVEGVTRGGWIWVRASVGLTNPNDVSTANLPTGIELALEVNGNLQHAGSIGAPDVGAEQMRSIAGFDTTSGGAPYLTKNQYGPGIRAYHDTAVVGCLVRVPEGPLTVQVMYRNVAPPAGASVQRLTGYTIGVLEVQGG